jgi:hypothetical protein
MTIITKYDYCQACHLLLTDCRCDSSVNAVTAEATDQELSPIWVSTWKLKIDSNIVLVEGVVVKGDDPVKISNNETYIKRALRGINGKAIVLEVTLDKQLGFGIKE